MQYLLSVKSRPDQSYEASVVGIPSCKGEGMSRDEAIAHAVSCLEQYLADGELVQVEVNVNTPTMVEAPSIKHAGSLASDSTFEDFVNKLAEIRKQANLINDEI